MRSSFPGMAEWAAAGSLSLLIACGGDEKNPPRAAAQPAPTAQAAGERASGELPPTMTTPPQPTPPPEQARPSAPIVVEEELQARCDLPVTGDDAPRFEPNAIELNESGEEILDAVATCLGQGGLTGESIRVTGHTDASGPDDYNLRLGMRRAIAVRQYLSNRGVPAGAIIVGSEGENEATGDAESDRRVEIEVATPESPAEQPEESPPPSSP